MLIELIKAISIALFVVLIYPGHIFADEPEVQGFEPWQYRLGEGLRISDSDVFLGGYINIEYSDTENEREKLAMDDLSLFIFGDMGTRSNFFAEFELEEIVEIDSHGETGSEKHLLIERLYVDHLYSDQIKIRIGKFLTPVGSWNETHAPPITWTVSQPLVSFATFPEYITGLQLYGNFTVGEEDFSYTLSAQKNESINERTGFRRTHEFFGGRIRWMGPDGIEIGLPLLYYEEYEIEDKVYLSGIDFTYKNSPFELRGEATYSDVDIKNGGRKKEYGYYFQGVSGLTDKFSIVVRYDWFQAREAEKHHNSLTTGAVYKPKPPIVFKLEYQTRSGDLVYGGEENINDDERVLASFSVLM